LEKQRKNASVRACVAQIFQMFVALVIPFGAHGCGVQGREHEEARELLARISRLDPNAPLEQRSAELSAVEALPLQDQGLRAMRSVCLAAHRGLLDAERGQAAVRARLDGDKPEADLPALQAIMQKASAQLEQAQAALAQCEDQTRKATLRYR
jgi:hypothetical protein